MGQVHCIVCYPVYHIWALKCLPHQAPRPLGQEQWLQELRKSWLNETLDAAPMEDGTFVDLLAKSQPSPLFCGSRERRADPTVSCL